LKIFTETERLILREIVMDDAQDLFELDSDPNVNTYLGNQPATELQQSVEVVNHIRKQYQTNGIGRWAIIEKSTNEFIGWSGLKYESEIRENFSYYDVGYRLKKKFWGKGFATESAIASIQYGFDQLQLKEIYAAADIENIVSNKVLQKTGLIWQEEFEYLGTAHNWYKISLNKFNKS
jgi:ribosomal-protein-alanine N-acetyltransferase